MLPDIIALLVEDDDRLALFTKQFLEHNGVRVAHVSDGEEAVRAMLNSSFDIVILDLMLPRQDGMSVCCEIRSRSDVPIIMVTARIEESHRILGLEVGADDYLPKPYSVRELLARIRAMVRRAKGRAGPANGALNVGPLSLFPDSLKATLHGRPLELTSYEFSLLRVLAERKNRVLSREQLLELAKGNAEDAFDRSIDVRISRLRQKLGDDPRNPALLRTVRNAGYLLTSEMRLP